MLARKYQLRLLSVISPFRYIKVKRLYVKDMVVVDENLIGNNGVVHVIDCIMFVQPSSEDDRVKKELGRFSNNVVLYA